MWSRLKGELTNRILGLGFIGVMLAGKPIEPRSLDALFLRVFKVGLLCAIG
jgi:hypothetical protein